MGFIGSGRHRRPTQTERAVAAAGVAGVGIALPLLTATGAHAVAPTTWDAVAQCASAGNWTKDTGNGAYGGLQIDLRSWVAYGGDAYAAEPDHATREQQIAVAERILADRGASVWGSCATNAGLTGEGRPTTQPSAPATTTPSAPATTSTPSAPATTTPDIPAQRGSAAPVFPGMQGLDASGLYWYQANGTWYWTTSQQVYEQNTGTASPAPTPGTPAPDSATPGGATTAPTTTTTPAPGTPAPGSATDVPGTGATTAPGTGTTAPGTTAPGTTTDTTPGAPAATTGTPATTDGTGLPAPAATPDASSYTVAPGDTLSGISDTHKLGGWKHLYDQNQGTVGDNPDLIHPGQVLDIK